jgi:hypothetical protein
MDFSIANYLSLVSFASISWTSKGSEDYPNTNPATRRQWIEDLSGLINGINPTSHQITSILSLLSASVAQGVALPPYLHRKLIRDYSIPGTDGDICSTGNF